MFAISHAGDLRPVLRTGKMLENVVVTVKFVVESKSFSS